jgi:branched-chain amino acid transport system ATP-binding protein
MPHLLHIQHLSQRFGGLQAVDQLSFSIQPGEIMALIGPNGAGKSTVFNCISGLYRPQQGSILFQGTELVGKRPDQIARLGLGRTFQNLALFPSQTVREHLQIGQHRWQGKKTPRIEYWLERLELTPVQHQLATSLPHGLQKRVELGRALAMEPSLLLLDEPAAGLNASEQADLSELLRRIQAESGLALVLIEHRLALVHQLAQRVLVLQAGKLLRIGPTEAVMRDPLVQQAYLGIT